MIPVAMTVDNAHTVFAGQYGGRKPAGSFLER